MKYIFFLFFRAPGLHQRPLNFFLVCLSSVVCCDLSDLCLFFYLSSWLGHQTISPLGLIKLTNPINSKGKSGIGLASSKGVISLAVVANT